MSTMWVMPSSVPGLVDTHVHINEPGREDWEGFSFATRAAVAGGVTTLVDMPLNSVPPTTTVQSLEEKREAARGQCSVDVGFLGGVVPGNTAELARPGGGRCPRVQGLHVRVGRSRIRGRLAP